MGQMEGHQHYEYQATWAPKGRTAGEFYSGVVPGHRVRVAVEVWGDGRKSYSIQSLENPGAWLAVYDPEDLIQ